MDQDSALVSGVLGSKRVAIRWECQALWVISQQVLYLLDLGPRPKPEVFKCIPLTKK